jgi:hypothetical protein
MAMSPGLRPAAHLWEVKRMNVQVRVFYTVNFTYKDEGVYSDGRKGFYIEEFVVKGFLAVFLPTQMEALEKLMANDDWIVDYVEPENTDLPENLLEDHTDENLIRTLYPAWKWLEAASPEKDFTEFLFNPNVIHEGMDTGFFLEDGTKMDTDDIVIVDSEANVKNGVLSFLSGGEMERYGICNRQSPDAFELWMNGEVERYFEKTHFMKRIRDLLTRGNN